MDSLDFSFKLEIDGHAIAEAGKSEETSFQAAIGDDTAAVFTLRDGRLMAGEWILSRKRVENRSLGPKPVLWFKIGTESEKQAQPVTFEKEGENYQIKFTSLMVKEGKVLANLHGNGPPNSVVKV